MNQANPTGTASRTAIGAELAGEQKQLTACRWGLILLGAGFFLLLVALPLAILATRSAVGERSPSESTETTIPPYVYLVALGGIAAQLPGAMILWRVARSKRWKTAATILSAALACDAACLVFVVAYARNAPATGSSKLVIELAARTGEILGWLELWLVAILVAEFAMASRAQSIVQQTERLGYLVLSGGALTIVTTAWLALDPMLLQSPDELFRTTELIRLVTGIIGQIWTLRLLAATATLARLLGEKCAEVLATHTGSTADPV